MFSIYIQKFVIFFLNFAKIQFILKKNNKIISEFICCVFTLFYKILCKKLCSIYLRKFKLNIKITTSFINAFTKEEFYLNFLFHLKK
jgi:hypothetical protein